MSALPLRPAAPADRAALEALLDSAALPTGDLDSAPGLRFWVVVDGAALVGAIGLERYGDAALLRSVAVAASHRGRGLGRRLVAALEAEAGAAGVRQLVLLTQTAEAYFGALGYRAVARTAVPADLQQAAQFRSLCPASATCMAKPLPGTGA